MFGRPRMLRRVLVLGWVAATDVPATLSEP